MKTATPYVPSAHEADTQADNTRESGKSAREFPVHVLAEHLPILEEHQQVVIDHRFKIFAILHDHPSERARIVHHGFSQNALRVFIPLLKSPYYCPYSYLKAAYEATWETLYTVLFAPTIEAVTPFYTAALRHQQHLDMLQNELTRTFKQRPYEARQKQLSNQWDMELRSVQRPMQEVMRHASLFNFKVLQLRVEGYRLERLVREKPIDARYMGRARQSFGHKAG